MRQKRTRNIPKDMLDISGIENNSGNQPQPTLPGTKEPTIEVRLPHGYTVECNDDDEHRQVCLDAKPYLGFTDQIPDEFGRTIWLLVTSYQKYYRIQKQLDDAGIVADLVAKDPKAYIALQQQQHRILSDISNLKKDLEPLKLNRVVEGSVTEFITEQKDAAKAYAEEHIGEFAWRCGICGGINLMEVPHFAFDPAIGPHNGVWNQEIFELVRRHYAEDRELEDNYDGSLSVKDAAKILRISPIGILMVGLEREFDFGFTFDPDKPETMAPYIE